MAFSLNLILILFVSVLPFHGLADSAICPKSDIDSLVGGIRSQSPLSIERFSPEEVTGDKLDKDLRNAKGNAYHSIFFYASWCPFSRKTRPVFYALSSMFPQIRHLAVKQSSAMPSVFSRYGIHSFPSILIANGTSRVQYHGPKDLDSLVKFYKETTGLDPVAYFSVEQSPNTESRIPKMPHMRLSLWDHSLKETLALEAYLVFSFVFLFLKAFVSFFPMIITRFKAIMVMYSLHLNLGFFGEWSHLLSQVFHVIDIKKLWSKLHLSNKTRNFQKGAKNARVWASSLASVSLGESSSSRDS